MLAPTLWVIRDSNNIINQSLLNILCVYSKTNTRYNIQHTEYSMFSQYGTRCNVSYKWHSLTKHLIIKMIIVFTKLFINLILCNFFEGFRALTSLKKF